MLASSPIATIEESGSSRPVIEIIFDADPSSTYVERDQDDLSQDTPSTARLAAGHPSKSKMVHFGLYGKSQSQNTACMITTLYTVSTGVHRVL